MNSPSGNCLLEHFTIFKLDRSRIEALGIFITVHELDDSDRRGIAVTVTRLQHARISARPVGISLGQGREQFLDEYAIAHRAERLTACM